MKSKLFSGVKQFWQLIIYKPVLEANYFVAQLANSLYTERICLAHLGILTS